MAYGNSSYGGGPSTLQSTATLTQLREETYAILNDTQTSNVYSPAVVAQALNDEQVGVCMKKKWQFLRQKQPLLIGEDTTVTTSFTTQDTSITIGTVTNYQDPSAVWVNGDIINYTGISSLTLTGCTNIEINHDSGEKVYPLYEVPSDYWRMPIARRQNTGSDKYYDLFYIDELELDNDQLGFNEVDNKFTIHFDNNGQAYLRFVNGNVGDKIMFSYLKRPLTMSEDLDVATIPDPWAMKILPKLAAYKLMIIRGDNIEGLGSDIMQIAQSELMEMEKYFGYREQGTSKLIPNVYRSGIRSYRHKRTVRI